MKYIIAVLAFALAGCAPKTEKVLICETDTNLTEAHAEVSTAQQAGGVWQITYVSGQQAAYVQAPGETCRLIPADGTIYEPTTYEMPLKE